MQAPTIFWNIDESAISSSDNSQYCWYDKEERNSLRERTITPRLTMIAALSSDGRIVMSLLQANSNEETFCLFLSHFARTLEAEDKNFRAKTCFQIDNARYHTTSGVIAHLEALGLRFIRSGPYSYNASPIERFFGYFKSRDLNPNGLKTGKRVSNIHHLTFFSPFQM